MGFNSGFKGLNCETARENKGCDSDGHYKCWESFRGTDTQHRAAAVINF